jgi:hypothetical protein
MICYFLGSGRRPAPASFGSPCTVAKATQLLPLSGKRGGARNRQALSDARGLRRVLIAPERGPARGEFGPVTSRPWRGSPELSFSRLGELSLESDRSRNLEGFMERE